SSCSTLRYLCIPPTNFLDCEKNVDVEDIIDPIKQPTTTKNRHTICHTTNIHRNRILAKRLRSRTYFNRTTTPITTQRIPAVTALLMPPFTDRPMNTPTINGPIRGIQFIREYITPPKITDTAANKNSPVFDMVYDTELKINNNASRPR
ncbi:MAG: hypothetical protein KAU03_06995, partial [Candidatus Altiarchaeales archaeon]|nr:hypothetical protein [Candidatus Altiarchaeales archaeon]